MQSFDIYFLGETLPNADHAGVRRGVARLFKVQEDAVERLFSGKPLKIKQAVDIDTAGRYRAAFREVGALIQIVPAGSPPPAAAPPPQQPAAQTATDAHAVTAADAATPAAGPAGDMDLAAPGAIIDDTPQPPPAEIDTSAFEALPPNTGSLEDCQVEKPPRPIPDISHLKLVDD
jgi:hypothetical protein